MPPTKQRLKNIGAITLKVSITFLLLYVIVTRTNVDGIVAAVSQFSYRLIALIALLNIGAVYISALKWRMLLPEVSLKDLAAACFVSYYFSLLLPGQIAQEGAKAYYIDRRALPKRHRIASSILVDKILSIIGLLLVGCIGVIFTQKHLPATLVTSFFASTGAALLFLFSLRVGWVYQLGCRLAASAARRFPRGRVVFDACRNILDSWHLYTKNVWMLVANTALGILYQMVGVLSFYLLADSLHLNIGFFDWSWIVGALTLALFLPLTIGGLGVREGALIGILAMYGCSKETAIAVSLAFFSVVLILAIIGVAFSLTMKVSRKKEA